MHVLTRPEQPNQVPARRAIMIQLQPTLSYVNHISTTLAWSHQNDTNVAIQQPVPYVHK